MGIFQEATKDHFDMTTLIFSTGGCPSYPFYSFKRGPWYPFSGLVTENPSREVATKDHSSSNPRKGNPPDLKTKVDVSKVDVKGLPILGVRTPEHVLNSVFCCSPSDIRGTYCESSEGGRLPRGPERIPGEVQGIPAKSGELLGKSSGLLLFKTHCDRSSREVAKELPGKLPRNFRDAILQSWFRPLHGFDS